MTAINLHSLRSIGSDWPHNCCHMWIMLSILTTDKLADMPKTAPFRGDSDPHLIHSSSGARNPHPKQHLDRFSHFSTAHTNTHRQTDHATSVTIGRVLFCAQQCGLIMAKTVTMSCHVSFSPLNILPNSIHWVITLSVAETKVSNFSLKPKYQTKSFFNFGLSKCKQNKYVMHDVVAQGGIITATDQMLNIKNFFLHLPVRWDDRSETWFKTLCMLIRSQTLVSDESLRLRSQWKIKWPTAIKSSRAQSYKSTAHYH